MKLRNKKTGAITELDLTVRVSGYPNSVETREVKSLAEFNEEWEDYKPAEPLIKDEKIRKAVRAWAEANDISRVFLNAGWNAFKFADFMITFDYDFDRHDGLKDNKNYSIAELCEEEEG